MRNIKKIIWGIILLVVGIVFALNTFGVTDVDLLFPGWWTMFIIVPCFIGLVTEKDKSGNIIGLLVGVLLLLWQLEVLDLSHTWEIIVIAVLAVIGIKLIVGGAKKDGDSEFVKVSVDAPAGTAIFGGKEMNFDGQMFEGCELTAIFGGVECDLSRAIIEKDCVIKATAIFGGVDIVLPKGVNVKIKSTNIFGGTDDSYERVPDSQITVCIESVAIFGGVDLK